MKDTPHANRPPLIGALLDPRRYPHAVDAVECIETHISWVLLAGEFAYKIKKPVALGFLDFSTLAARRHFCLEELRLNRATAPQLYLDVVALTGDAAAPQFGGAGPPFEYALRMRRFPQAALFDRLARCGEIGAGLVDRLAETVAAFHARTAVAGSADDHGSPDNISRPALENFAQIAGLAPPADAAAALARLRDWTAAASLKLRPAFAARKAAGCVRECHGDLHLGNIALIDGQPVAFDRIEFNAELRWIDVMSELAFLVMDFLDRGLLAQAWRCLNRYLEISGDYEGIGVLRFYLVYRAMVRAKVALIHARQPEAGALRSGEEASFMHHLQLADRFAAAQRPALVLMHGLSGSGKSTVSQTLLERLGALRVRSDVERKRLHGLLGPAHGGGAASAGLYEAATTRRTYERLAAVAEAALRAGWCTIVDATFLQRQLRNEFRRVAQRLGASFLIVSCHAGEAELRDRLKRRRVAGADASDADAEVLASQIRRQQPPGDDELCELISLDASVADTELAARVAARLM